MNTVFARALVGFSVLALPATSIASTKAVQAHSHSHSLAKKDAAPKKKGKHHAHKATTGKALATAPAPNKAP